MHALGAMVGASTTAFLETLDAFSGHTLTRRDDLGLLMELSSVHGKKDVLSRLSFFAKFVCRVHGMMKRLGREDDRYAMLEREFARNLEEATSLAGTLIALAPRKEQDRFAGTYLQMTPSGLENLLALLCDIAWYKNWLIDHGGDAKR